MDETVYQPLDANLRLVGLPVNNESHSYRSKSSFSKVSSKCKVFFSKFPYFIVIISLIQTIFYIKGTQYTYSQLKFYPDHYFEKWRYLSYMLLHRDPVHIILNIIIQCLVATPLESEQGSMRVAVVYLYAGLAGSLATKLMNPTLSLVGCSAGVYALLMSHIPNNIVNSDVVRYKSYRIFSVFTLCVGDIFYYLMQPAHESLPTISWASHVAGGLAGLLLGFVVYTNQIMNCTYYIKFFVTTCLLVSIFGFIIEEVYVISFTYA